MTNALGVVLIARGMRGAVSTITTIMFSYTLISLVLTRLLIREEELTMRTVAGSVLVVVGVAAVILL